MHQKLVEYDAILILAHNAFMLPE